MSRLRKIVREIHRRSLWQVLAVYLAGSWVALQVAGLVTQTAALPEWVPSFALVILVVGFPIVMAAALIQEAPSAGEAQLSSTDVGGRAGGGRAGEDPRPTPEVAEGEVAEGMAPTPPAGLPGLLSWSRVRLGGIAALALLVVVVGGSLFFSRSGGFGAPETLVAQGIFAVGEPIIVADFRNSTTDPVLGSLVSEALRADLASSDAITLVTPAAIRETLLRMQQDPSGEFTPERAQDVATRLGVKAVLEGEVGMAGGGYILLATLRSPLTGEPLASFRLTAANDEALLPALDDLSTEIRERAGESLRSIQATPRLATVTTPSLEALRLYTQASDRTLQQGDYGGALGFLRDAVALDPEFAMAWRRLAVILGNMGTDNPGRVAAGTRAFELGHRLNEIERHHTAAFFHTSITGDDVRAARAYEAILDRAPDDLTALLNLSMLHGGQGRLEEALALLEHTRDRYEASPIYFVSLANTLIALRRFDEAAETLSTLGEEFPQAAVGQATRGHLLHGRGLYEEGLRHGLSMAENPRLTPFFQTIGRAFATTSLAATGRWVEADRLIGEERRVLLAQERGFDYLEFSWLHGEVAHLMLPGREEARRILREVLASGALEAGLSAHPLGGGTLPYREFAILAARIGMQEEAEDLLVRWEVEGSVWSADPIARTRLAVSALNHPDPAEGAALLRRYRAELNCPTCFQWELAERLRQAERWEEAREAYAVFEVRHEDNRRAGLHIVLSQKRLGQVYAALGEIDEAVRRFRAFAAAWDSADAVTRFRVEEALRLAEALETGG